MVIGHWTLVIPCLLLFSISGRSVSAAPLQWEQHPGYRVARLAVPAGGRAGFTLLRPEQTGLFFTNRLSYERSLTNQNLLDGAGACAGDFDGDGLPDLYFCNLEGPNGLFRNLGGFRFEDVTLAAGVACTNQASRGAAFADINGDGWPDLLVTSFSGPNACLVNDGRGHFQDRTREAGLVLWNAGSTSLALADVDGDGALDLYISNTGIEPPNAGSVSVRMVNGKPQVVGRMAQRYKLVDGRLITKGFPHAFYRNDGQGHFTPVSWTDGTFRDENGQPLREAPRDIGLSAAFRDLNGDGAPDLYVCNDWETPDRIWLNDGQGHFRALPDLAVRTTSLFSMSVDFADIDRDGFDDFFVNDMISRFHQLRLTQVGGTNPPPAYVGETRDRHQARRNTLQLNRGDGTYAEIANFAGVEASDWTWCVAFLDVDLDGYEDLLAVNGHLYDLQDIDRMTSQQEGGPPLSNLRGGQALKDYPPLRTPHYLFRNQGDRTFQEMGAAWGFNTTNVSHGIVLADLDNDGDLDVVVSCLGAPPLVYRNDSSAPRVAVRLKGKAPNTAGIGGKIILRGGAVPMQSQEIQCGGRYLSSDQPMRVFAAGALTNRMTLEVKWRSGRQSFLTNVEPNCLYEIQEQESGVSSQSSVVGSQSSVATTQYAIRNTSTLRSTATEDGQPPSSNAPPLFADVSERIAHTHHDPPFDDLQFQPLLSKSLSRLGPGVAWYDLDGDGHDELIIGAGRGGTLAVFRNDGKGGFSRWDAEAWSAPVPDDLAGVAGWTPAGQQRSLLVGLSNYEQPEKTPSAVWRFDFTSTGTNPPVLRSSTAEGGQSAIRLVAPKRSEGGNPQSPALSTALVSVGPLAVADLDGRGALDLFVGGRVVPRRYPEPASSFLYRNRRGALERDEANSRVLQNAGLVSGAVFSDLDGDGFPELILACEWGPLKIFRNDHGRLVPWDPPVTLNPEPGTRNSELGTLSQLTGWWTAVTTGDFDGDGRMDIVACNWGLNSSSRQPTPQQPARLYYGDFDDNGTTEVVEACTDPDSGRIVPRRDLAFLRAGWPALRTRFASHREFAQADMAAVLGEAAPKAAQVQASTLATMVFLNRGGRFEALRLPAEAQFAPAFAACVGDLDGDGREDIFLSQNFFALRPEEPRLDAGRGLWLRGDGAGHFHPVPGQESGLRIYGEQRGAALGDFDEDGRVDLVVTQNGGATRLFRNQGARPGLRVRLAGPPGNPQGIGATLRLSFGPALGPARELHAGSGYWSQDSAVPVMALPAPPTSLSVRWPGGKVTTSPLPAGAREIEVDYLGNVKALKR